MGFRNYVKNTVKDNVNVKGWAAWDTIKQNSKTIGSLIQDLKAPDLSKSVVKITFAETMKKYGLTEKDLQRRMKTHLFVAVFCAVLGFGAIGWGIYLLSKGMITSALVALALAALMLAYTFREHFFYFQIKQRRLDCAVKEWFSNFFSKK